MLGWISMLTEPSAPELIAGWLLSHHVHDGLDKAEFTLSLADLVVAVETERSCQTAAELDPQFTPQATVLSIAPI